MKSFAEVSPKLINEWSEKNGNLKPANISYGSNRKVWWNGRCGHTWLASVKNRVRGSSCPFCSGNRVLSGVNDLATAFPDLVREWSDKNLPLKPSEVTVKANKELWWRCSSCGYEWKARVADRTEGHGCPVCAGAIVVPGINDLATLYPEISDEWSYKNRKSPMNASSKSREPVLWKCRICGFEWKAVVYTRVKGQKCPNCLKRRRFEENELKKCDKVNYLKENLRKTADLHRLRVIFDDDSEIGVPLSFYFPDNRIAVEIMGKSQNLKAIHNYENGKNWLCRNAGIRMIRILTPGSIDFSNCECVKMENNDMEAVYDAVKIVLNKIEENNTAIVHTELQSSN